MILFKVYKRTTLFDPTDNYRLNDFVYILQAVEKVQHAIILMTGKMTPALERIEERLDRLEATPISTDYTPLENVSINYNYLCSRNNCPLLISISHLLCV